MGYLEDLINIAFDGVKGIIDDKNIKDTNGLVVYKKGNKLVMAPELERYVDFKIRDRKIYVPLDGMWGVGIYFDKEPVKTENGYEGGHFNLFVYAEMGDKVIEKKLMHQCHVGGDSGYVGACFTMINLLNFVAGLGSVFFQVGSLIYKTMKKIADGHEIELSEEIKNKIADVYREDLIRGLEGYRESGMASWGVAYSLFSSMLNLLDLGVKLDDYFGVEDLELVMKVYETAKLNKVYGSDKIIKYSRSLANKLLEKAANYDVFPEKLRGIKKIYLSGSSQKVLEALTKFEMLEELDLSHCGLTELPESIGNLRNLEVLDLENNELTELPESILDLRNLKELDIGGNRLTKLPESFGGLKNLRRLNLGYNKLTELPESIGNLRNLEVLDLENNELTELPESIGNLRNLEVLDLKNNGFTELPESIGE